MPAAPAAPPPAAPAKPATAPAAAPSTPRGTPAPAPAPDPRPPASQEDYEADLDALDDGRPAPQKPPETPSDNDKATVKPPETPVKPTKPDDGQPPKPAATAKPDKPPKAADLRAAYDGLKQRVAQDLEPKLARLESENAELKKNGGGDLKTITDRLTAAEKRRDELEAEMRFIDYSKSAEFQQKYAEPLKKAWARALADLKEIQVETDDGSGGVSTREATTDDIVQLANMPLGQARKTANAMFGDNADDVMAHVRNLRQLSDAQQEALADARKSGEERAKQTTAQRTADQKRAVELWQTENKTLADKYPKWFAPDAEDPEGSDLLSKGFALADRLFSPTDETAPKTLEERVRLHAQIRNRAAAALPLARKLKQSNARIAELEKELEAYQKSAPSAGTAGAPGRAQSGNWRDDVDSEIDALNVPSLG